MLGTDEKGAISIIDIHKVGKSFFREFIEYEIIILNINFNIRHRNTNYIRSIFFILAIILGRKVVKMLILKYPFVLSLMLMASPILGTPLFELMLRPQPGNYELYNMNVSTKFYIIFILVLDTYLFLLCIKCNLKDVFLLT